MTEKNAAFGNNFTPEQRSAALKRATEMRAARAEYLGRVKSGEVSIADALEAGKGDPVVGRIKAKRLLMALPGIGAAKAQSAMTAIGISETRRVAGIGQRQAEKLIELFRVGAPSTAPTREHGKRYGRPWSRRPSGGGSFSMRSRAMRVQRVLPVREIWTGARAVRTGRG